MRANPIPRPDTFSCPCCGGYIGEAAPIEMVVDAISPTVERAILIRLSKSLSRPVPRDTLIDFIYSDDRNGGPDNAQNVFAVSISRLRRRLAAFGWTIQTIGGGGGRGGVGDGANYRLVPTEAGA